MKYHRPVLLEACIEALNIKKGGVYVDATFGGGGHSREILKNLGSEGRLVGFDRDIDARANIQNDERFQFAHHNYCYLNRFLKYFGYGQVDGVLADLGISSHQIDQEDRGFSIRFAEAMLDMRMDQDKEIHAGKILNEYDQFKLFKIFKDYGELKSARAVSKRILTYRASRSISKAKDVFEALDGMVPKSKENRFFAQVFQAIRIEVNDEMESLKEFLIQAEKVLRPGGRLVVLSYHSLEDRIVKRFVRSGFNKKNDVLPDLAQKWSLKAINTKPILPSDIEIAENSRARSAKLRIAEKVES